MFFLWRASSGQSSCTMESITTDNLPQYICFHFDSIFPLTCISFTYSVYPGFYWSSALRESRYEKKSPYLAYSILKYTSPSLSCSCPKILIVFGCSAIEWYFSSSSTFYLILLTSLFLFFGTRVGTQKCLTTKTLLFPKQRNLYTCTLPSLYNIFTDAYLIPLISIIGSSSLGFEYLGLYVRWILDAVHQGRAKGTCIGH